jgi:aquaporin related protein
MLTRSILVRLSYWLGPALGACVAAGFYKFIKYLEYETVLGPEADADDTRPSGAAGTSGGAPTMTGPNTAAGGMYEDKSKSKGSTMAVMGTGLGDLLTHGNPADVSDRLEEWLEDRARWLICVVWSVS